MADKKAKYYARLEWWLILPTVTVMISSVCVFASVDFFSNYILAGNKNYNAIRAIGMFFPMGLVMGSISYFCSKATYRCISKLTEGIRHVANGDFGVRLDPDKAGPLKEVYANFNKMGTELKSVQTLRNDFINSFSHEFKTPITSINGFAMLLLEENVLEENRRKYLQIIAEESERLAALSNNSLLLSKLESQQFIVDKKPYPLDEQIKQCAILLSSEWSKKDIEFSAELEPVIFNGNSDLMQHVWINLLNNAIKFTPEHGEVSIAMKKDDSFIKVAVSDSGKGMGEKEMSQIFVKYYQGNSSDPVKGLGLGLSIVKKIADLCGGKIEVKSVIGEGSTLTVYLPYAPAK